uniref:AN1-type domain-containing protein n=1 Tax=Ditylenchus dipsaci TaxID=166011 RepID=A0A915EPL3_9BILA
MAEFPDFGKHCSVPECRLLEFLPMKCDACTSILCSQHILYDAHRCQSAYRKNIQVPVCPLCNKPVPTAKNELPDQKVGEHIDRDCKSDPAKQKRNDDLQCSMLTCKKRELVPINCRDCRRNFCLNHRHTSEHNCLKHKENPMLRKRSGSVMQVAQNFSTENDEELAKALHAAMNGNFPSVDPEEMSRRLARQLQEEEYRNSNGNQSQPENSSQRCNVS